ncbi:MAG: glycosyltransferase family 4 protein [Bryobacteraceae bacterium]|nr:glycosyltransferase family 4 protein [Bryobacteraceae bacterium]
MKFCILTTFFGSHSFGGDSVYVDRLSRALLRRGHEVHVAFSSGAYQVLPDRLPVCFYQPPSGLVLHDLGHGLAGRISAVWAHQTGRALWFGPALERLFRHHRFDVIHVHNLSLLGAKEICRLLRTQQALRVATLHDYWWVCPLSLLRKNRTAECVEPSCFACNLRSQRPPQLWRNDTWFNEALGAMDAVLFPSRSAMEICRCRGLRHEAQFVLPGMLTQDWCMPPEAADSGGKPYFAAAGRLVPEKGFGKLIPLMGRLPDVELLIAGAGPAESALRRAAKDLPNVRLLGLLDHQRIQRLFRGARAVLVPSQFPETFGLAAAEALSLGTPVIARNLGSLPELIEATSGGLLYDEEEQLAQHMRTLAYDDRVRERLSRAARSGLPAVWLEEGHTKAYLSILEACASTRQRGGTA